MSIVDAIQKAKRIAQQRIVDDQRAPRAKQKPYAARAPIAREQDTTQPERQFDPVKFDALLPYDALVCGQNHIIVPDVEAAFALQARAPYRMLRALILQRCRANGWTSLGVTSPGPGEGKSVTALNLAISVAREGNYDVFLIDLDMRSPSTCRYLGVSPKIDIVSYFEGHAVARDVFFSIGIERLTIAGSSTSSDHSSELLANGKFEDLIEFVKQSASNPLIIIDLPPIVNTDDALVVAPKIDATVLIASQGRTRRDSLDRAIGLLTEHTLAGVILNKSQETMGSDYYGEYGTAR
jgi:protein-tyrosine kinase